MVTFACNDSSLVAGPSILMGNSFNRGAKFEPEYVANDVPDYAAKDVPPKERAKFIIIESRTLLRECLERSIRERTSFDVASFSNVAEWFSKSKECRAALILLCVETLSKEEEQRELVLLSTAIPVAPTIVVAEKDDLNDALEALRLGAKGYISTSTGLDVAIEAMQFVSAGGTYVPVECVLAAKHFSTQAAPSNPTGTFTSRELAVIQAIRRGRSNKMIAYQLNMCESTVKVHVRHIMKKLHARNRTEVAIRAAEIINFQD